MAAFANAWRLAALLIFLLPAAPSIAADLNFSQPKRPATRLMSPASPQMKTQGGDSGPSIFGYHKVDKACRAWDDGCRTCVLSIRDGAPAASCSNIGIACQPRDIKCTDPAKSE